MILLIFFGALFIFGMGIAVGVAASEEEAQIRQGHISLPAPDVQMIRLHIQQLERALDYEKQRTIKILNEIWGRLYPGDPHGWEYPDQVIRHLREELAERKRAA